MTRSHAFKFSKRNCTRFSQCIEPTSTNCLIQLILDRYHFSSVVFAIWTYLPTYIAYIILPAWHYLLTYLLKFPTYILPSVISFLFRGPNESVLGCR